jgi:integrase
MPHRLSRAERTLAFLAMSLILYLGPRRSDVIKFGLGDVRNQVIHFRIEKNNPRLRKELAIPIVPALDDVLKLERCAFSLNRVGFPNRA